MRERVTWKGEREDFVEEGDAEREEGCPKPKYRLGLVGGDTGSTGRGGVMGGVLEEESTKTEPSLHPIPTLRVLVRLPFSPLSCSAGGVAVTLGGPQNAMQEETQEERASSAGSA